MSRPFQGSIPNHGEFHPSFDYDSDPIPTSTPQSRGWPLRLLLSLFQLPLLGLPGLLRQSQPRPDCGLRVLPLGCPHRPGLPPLQPPRRLHRLQAHQLQRHRVPQRQLPWSHPTLAQLPPQLLRPIPPPEQQKRRSLRLETCLRKKAWHGG